MKKEAKEVDDDRYDHEKEEIGDGDDHDNS